MNFQTRKARPQDANALAKILRELSWFAHLASESLETTQERVSRHLNLCFSDDSHSVYVAETGPGQVVGYAAVHWLPYLFLSGPEGHVSELFIRESARGQGIGSRLLAAIKTEAKARGCARLALINIRSRESYQRHFYKKIGWQEREEVANFVYIME